MLLWELKDGNLKKESLMYRLRLSAVVCVAVLLGGCATYQSGNDFNESQIDEIEQGQTTKADIEQWFGSPTGTGTQYIDGENMEHYTYSYSEGGATAESYIPFVGAFLGGVEAESKTLHVYFNEEDVVRRHSYSEQSHDTQNTNL